MIKSLVIASTVVLAGAAGAVAAEVGYTTQSGSSSNTITHGRAYQSYNGRSVTRSRTVEVNGTAGLGGRLGGGGAAGGVAGSFDRTVSRTKTVEKFRGGSTNRFSGSSNSSFSGASIFAN